MVGERVATVGEQLVQVLRLGGQREVEHLEQLLRVVEVEDLRRAVVRFAQELDQDVRQAVQERPRLGVRVRGKRQQVCENSSSLFQFLVLYLFSRKQQLEIFNHRLNQAVS